jgi:dTDP-4-amino-4,6-dideoxygalactose transaminase
MIPFHVPVYDHHDEEAFLAVLRSGHLVGDGPCTKSATAAFAAFTGAPHVLLTSSCTHALELAVMALHLEPDDEVIVPSFTFVSTPNAILRAGTRVVFADIRPDTLTLDPVDVERHLTSRTRAVIPIVYAGVSPEMDTLMALLRPRGIRVIEDAAQGVDAWYKGRHSGTIGDIGCFSFHETKNFSTGEGGAFCTGDDALMAAAEIIREKGTNRRQFLQGLVDRYTWVDVGSSFLPPDSMGALLETQLAKREEIGRRRWRIHERYVEAFTPLTERGLLQLPVIPHDVRSNYHLFFVLFAEESLRNRALAAFREQGITTTFHYLPLHLSPVGRSLGCRPGDCPVTESVSGRLLRLPIYPGLGDAEQGAVIATMKEFFSA